MLRLVPPGGEYQILSRNSAVDGSIWHNLFSAAADPTSDWSDEFCRQRVL